MMENGKLNLQAGLNEVKNLFCAMGEILRYLYLSLAKAETFEKKLLVSISFEFTGNAYCYQSEIPVTVEGLRLNQTLFPKQLLSIKLVPANFDWQSHRCRALRPTAESESHATKKIASRKRSGLSGHRHPI